MSNCYIEMVIKIESNKDFKMLYEYRARFCG